MSEDRKKQRQVRRRARRWAELLMETSSLRDNLNDAQAQQLLDWGLAQIKHTAVTTAHLPADDAHQQLEKDTTAVKLIMQGINDLIGSIGQPPDFDIIDDTMKRLLKNQRWLTDQPPSSDQLKNVSLFNQAREAKDEVAAFQYLINLIDTTNTPPSTASNTAPPPTSNT